MIPLLISLAFANQGVISAKEQERTAFQTGATYRDGLNVGADTAIVYGFGNNMPSRVDSWRKKGYGVHLMTGVAWGEYQDYLYGRFDGHNHEDEAQTDEAGNKIGHGGDVYYMSPGPTYGKYLAQGVRKALEAGVQAVHLEEPEFWVRAGYEPAFKREWKQFYGEDWQPPDGSPEAQWRASKLKYMLYRRALQQVFDDIQAYNRQHQTGVRCYVATHSLLNYADWRIVSPESSLAQLKGCDGYIAQVWTGTARTPNTYDGIRAERTFETAFLEYGAMMNVARATGKRLWFLADPVEDDPKHDWGDYRRNYESTLTASLLQPDIWRYEVMPWPERVFGGQYPTEQDPSKKSLIPPSYATELQVVIQALERIGDQKVSLWDCGTKGIGVVVSDSLMFERGGPSPSDPDLSNIYGLALPFVMRGAPVQPVQLETSTPEDLENYKLLLMTYRGMKPMTEDADEKIAAWVKRGGTLLFVDDDGDPFNSIREWWNTGANHFASPRQHLFRSLGIPDEPGRHQSSAGAVLFIKEDPAATSHDPSGSERLVTEAKAAAEGTKISWRDTNWLVLRRGRYIVASGVQSRPGPVKPHVLIGDYVNLFDPEIKLVASPTLSPGQRMFLLDLSRPAPEFDLLASACKAGPITTGSKGIVFSMQGIEDTPGIVLIKCPSEPKSVTLAGKPVTDKRYDAAHHLLWIKFNNKAAPRTLEVKS